MESMLGRIVALQHTSIDVCPYAKARSKLLIYRAFQDLSGLLGESSMCTFLRRTLPELWPLAEDAEGLSSRPSTPETDGEAIREIRQALGTGHERSAAP
jgi:hypothetical protein